ncbi:DUF5776 domain-containing protein [Staphylococcus sp. ACRSN]|uniref:DUF5776 domain-containing protein n=1 Tax=Staphylococcus sp. ACRSN TaxID=2918214 RepID=UPI001EF2EE4C|nr:DUF5776 domain-containing protein [Staphylococcus sp. ACRSN]MCG7338731.1 DUF5776 domain-containing protein [Staphylococcus sp. ACRSN]
MDKLITIIVPVYNKELFLHDCIESINNLDIDNNLVEAIFVDDCSTDHSLSIINSYLDKYNFLELIQLEENTGSPAEPRNVGIEKASGKYITFLDADDWLDREGFPNLLKQAEAHHSDIAFGQSIKHDDKGISKLGRFISYKIANHLVPYKIDKIFRAVGPPGKIIKTEIIKKENIKFKHLKFGEDKLFFIETISRCKSASMNTAHVYHVNRFNENQSLVTETNILEKTEDNLTVLKEILKLDLPDEAEFQAISRIIEVDFISRLYNKKRYLKSNRKSEFHRYFNEVVSLLNVNGKNIEDYIIEDKYKNNYKLIKMERYDALNNYIDLLIKGGKADRYLMKNQVHFLMPESLKDLIPVKEEMFAVYEGTHFISDNFYESIRVYKNSETKIDNILLTEIYNEPNAIAVKFQEKDGRIFINSNEFKKADFNFNLTLIYYGYKPYKVNMNLPNVNEGISLKRQNFRAEFMQKERDVKVKDNVKRYFHFNPKYINVLKKFNHYKDIEFKNKLDVDVELGEVIEVRAIEYTKKGTPRLVLKNGEVITANRNYVGAVSTEKNDKYYYEKPDKVKILNKCNEYETRKFKNNINTLNKNDVISIEKIVISPKGTPRFKTSNGTYITTNRAYVEAL